MFGKAQSLKSNMDRFIVIADVAEDESILRLKSNMDRFIVNICLSS